MSEKFPPGDRESHDDFCVTEKWNLVRGATGKPVKHHRTYELILWDGRILRTRISQPIDSSQYGPRMWSHILKNQLEVTPTEFWNCVREKELPDRGQATLVATKESIPLFLLRELTRLGIPEEEAITLSAAEAAAKRDGLLREAEEQL